MAGTYCSIALSWSELTKMSGNSDNVYFLGLRLICDPCLAIKSYLFFHRADVDKMRAANELYVLTTNLIVMLTATSIPSFCVSRFAATKRNKYFFEHCFCISIILSVFALNFSKCNIHKKLFVSSNIASDVMNCPLSIVELCTIFSIMLGLHMRFITYDSIQICSFRSRRLAITK